MAIMYYPVKGLSSRAPNVTSNFGYRNISYGSKWHHGIDIGASNGTPVLAAYNGKCTKLWSIGQSRGYTVQLQHTIQPYGTVYTFYQHLNAPSPLKVGDNVKMGDVIGYVGGSGTSINSYAAHLHFGISLNYPDDWYRSTCQRYDDYPQYTIGAVDPCTGNWLGVDTGETVGLNPGNSQVGGNGQNNKPSSDGKGYYRVTPTDGLNLRREPNTSSSVIVTIPYNTQIYVESISNGWAKATYSSYSGYCSADYLTFITGSTSTTEMFDYLTMSGNIIIGHGQSGNGIFYPIAPTVWEGASNVTYTPNERPSEESQGFGINFYKYMCYVTFTAETGSISYDNTGIWVPYDPLSIGCIGFCASNAKKLILEILNLDSSTSNYLSNYFLPNGQLLTTACKTQSDTWFWSKTGGSWNAPAVSDAQRPAMVSFLTSNAGVDGQNKLLYSFFNEYVEKGKAQGITDPQVMMYFCDLYNQNQQSALTVLGRAGGAKATLLSLHNAALASNTFGPYKTRRNKAYDLISAYKGQEPPEEMPDPSEWLYFGD